MKSGAITEFAFNVTYNAMQFFYIFHAVNLGIAIFNLIPVPPLDGSRILGLVLPPKYYFAIMRRERTIYYILLGWLLVGDFISDALLHSSLIAANPVLSIMAFCLSLSNILGFAIDGLSSLIIDFWSLFPFI